MTTVESHFTDAHLERNNRTVRANQKSGSTLFLVL